MVPNSSTPGTFDELEMDRTGPPQLGDRHPVYGEVVAIHWTGGERYYHFSRNSGQAMIPASAVEPSHASRR